VIGLPYMSTRSSPLQVGRASIPAWPYRCDGALSIATSPRRSTGPSHPGPEIYAVGMAVIRHGTEVQQLRFLRTRLRGNFLWLQGFEEPITGSDLLSMQTRATREGDEYIVSGQPICGNDELRVDWMYTLVRTSAEKSGRNRLSYPLMRDSSTDETHFVVSLGGVRVPVDNRVGDENAAGTSCARACPEVAC